MLPLKDSELLTSADISARLVIIRKNRDILCDSECRSNTATAFNAKQAKIAKLTAREGVLCNRLAIIRKG